jgi:hypothetical protein
MADDRYNVNLVKIWFTAIEAVGNKGNTKTGKYGPVEMVAPGDTAEEWQTGPNWRLVRERIIKGGGLNKKRVLKINITQIKILKKLSESNYAKNV